MVVLQLAMINGNILQILTKASSSIEVRGLLSSPQVYLPAGMYPVFPLIILQTVIQSSKAVALCRSLIFIRANWIMMLYFISTSEEKSQLRVFLSRVMKMLVVVFLITHISLISSLLMRPFNVNAAESTAVTVKPH